MATDADTAAAARQRDEDHARRTGVVAIGRNEGARLIACLDSVSAAGAPLAYVDSGSTDGSMAAARARGAIVVDLDDGHPFTAARARNAGFDALVGARPELELVMFIDGDCVLADGFLAAARDAFSARPDLGVVTGHCHERFPDASIYNRLAEMEWRGPIGDIDVCGGIFMTRRAAFETVGGFDPEIIAAEDDDYCLRVKASGARIRRIDRAMCFHDADMHRFSQWWRRARRAGVAYGQVGDRHPGHFAGERRRAVLWGAALPAAIIGLAPVTGGLSFLGAGLYGASYWRTRKRLIADGAKPQHADLHARFLTLSKFPNFIGLAGYKAQRLVGAKSRIIEYK